MLNALLRNELFLRKDEYKQDEVVRNHLFRWRNTFGLNY